MISATPLFGSETLPDVLALITTVSDETLTAREVSRRLGANLESTQRAMRRLADFGLARPSSHRNELRYMVERTDAVCFKELRALTQRVAGMGAALRQLSLELPIHAIEQAFIYGSIAEGTDRPESDVDLFVIGTAHLHDLSSFTWASSQRLQRDVVPIIRTRKTVEDGLTGNSSFYRSVLLGPKIMLVGYAAELPVVNA